MVQVVHMHHQNQYKSELFYIDMYINVLTGGAPSSQSLKLQSSQAPKLSSSPALDPLSLMELESFGALELESFGA